MTVLPTRITNAPRMRLVRARDYTARFLAALRSQIWYKALDAIVTAPTRPASSLGADLQAALRPRQANYDRVGALVAAVDHLLPGAAERAGRLLLRPEALGLRYDRCELLAYGSGGTVFLLTSATGQTVLKIYRRSLGLREPELTALAAEFRGKYDTVSAWYNSDRFRLVLPSSFAILHSPLRRVPALASLQRYIAPPHRDLFTAFGRGDLALLASVDEQFGQQLTHFVASTLRVYEEAARCLDFVGAENVIVVPGEAGNQLLIHDYGVFDLRDLAQRSPATVARVEERIGWLYALQPLLPRAREGAL